MEKTLNKNSNNELLLSLLLVLIMMMIIIIIDETSSFSQSLLLDMQSKAVFKLMNTAYHEAMPLAANLSIKYCIMKLCHRIDLPSLNPACSLANRCLCSIQVLNLSNRCLP